MGFGVGNRLTIPFTIGTSKIVGQGTNPELVARMSTSDVATSVPVWTDITSDVRRFSVSRGRGEERSEIDAGTASVVLDNRARTYDPISQATIKPMVRIWLQEQFGGETQDMYKGYVDSWELDYADKSNKDSTSTANCSDELKLLNLNALPVMDPPEAPSGRGWVSSLGASYEAVVMFDEPVAYWRCDDVSNTSSLDARVGPGLKVSGSPVPTISKPTPSPILGDPGAYLSIGGGSAPLTCDASPDSPLDAGNMSAWTIEFWYRFAANPAADGNLIVGPQPTSWTYFVEHRTTGVLRAQFKNSGGTNHTVSTGALATNTWHHIVVTLSGGTLAIYVNASQAATTAWTGVFEAGAANEAFSLGTITNQITALFDEVAIYRYGLSGSRILAHYTAGTARGFAGTVPGTRVGTVLDAVSSQAPRSIEAGTRTMIPTFKHGQSPLVECREAVRAESVSSMFFSSRSGTLIYYASRVAASTTDVWGDAGGAELPYEKVRLDSSERFLVNEWNASAQKYGTNPGILQTASDSTSISRYGKRSETLGDLPIVTDSDALVIADDLLAATKSPRTRITELELDTGHTTACVALFRYDLGSTVQVKYTPPGGGSRIDQTSLLQSIQIQGAPITGPNYAFFARVNWGISPAAPGISSGR